MDKPLVAVVMGSKSDWETMRHATDMLTRFGVPHQREIVSALCAPSDGTRSSRARTTRTAWRTRAPGGESG